MTASLTTEVDKLDHAGLGPAPRPLGVAQHLDLLGALLHHHHHVGEDRLLCARYARRLHGTATL